MKVVLDDIPSGYNLSKINENFGKIETALNEEVLYRKLLTGDPNQMETPLDMNGKRIFNLPPATLDSEPATFKQVKDNPGPQGLDGPQGEIGPQGIQGEQGIPGVGSDWNTLTNKPTVIAAGSDVTEARAVIGAGTSNLVIGTTPTTAKAGDYQPTITDVAGLQTTLNAKANSVTPTITGLKETRSIVGAMNIDIALGNVFTKTVSGVTTFTVSSVPPSGTVASFLLDLTNGGSSSLTWWSGVEWAGGTVPTLTVAGRDVLGFFTHNGGVTWTGLLLGKDVK